MSEPFLAEVRIFGFNFPPRGWALCDGQILPINQNQSLYSLLGTTYGGDGRTSFALPDLRGRVPIHVGNGHTLGQKEGEETHELTVAEMPNHNHGLTVEDANATTNMATNNRWTRAAQNQYRNYEMGTAVSMFGASLGTVGTNQSHENMQPFRTLSFCIALQGLFPSRN